MHKDHTWYLMGKAMAIKRASTTGVYAHAVCYRRSSNCAACGREVEGHATVQTCSSHLSRHHYLKDMHAYANLPNPNVMSKGVKATAFAPTQARQQHLFFLAVGTIQERPPVQCW